VRREGRSNYDGVGIARRFKCEVFASARGILCSATVILKQIITEEGFKIAIEKLSTAQEKLSVATDKLSTAKESFYFAVESFSIAAEQLSVATESCSAAMLKP